MGINITDLPIDLIIEILSKVSYDLLMFNLLYSNKYLYKILEDHSIVSRLIEPRVNHLVSCINDSKRCVAIVSNLKPFINMILVKYINLNIDVTFREDKTELIINMLVSLLNIHGDISIPVRKSKSGSIIGMMRIVDDYAFLISLDEPHMMYFQYDKFLYVTDTTNGKFNFTTLRRTDGKHETVDVIINFQGINSYNMNIESLSTKTIFKMFKRSGRVIKLISNIYNKQFSYLVANYLER